jgi:hypothetical protein
VWPISDTDLEVKFDQTEGDLLQGTLDLLILKALSLGPLHGYGIIKRIRQLSDELLAVEQGSLPGGLPDRAARLDQFQVGDRDRPPGQVLHAD